MAYDSDYFRMFIVDRSGDFLGQLACFQCDWRDVDESGDPGHSALAEVACQRDLNQVITSRPRMAVFFVNRDYVI